jgi:hypothetical protein
MLEINNVSEDPRIELPEKPFIFWDGAGKISPHMLFQFLAFQGIGNYFSDDTNKKNTDPLIVKVVGNKVSQVNVGYLLDITKRHILETTAESGESGPILDSLHRSTGLFSEKNLKLLPDLNLEFISDTPDCGYFFFKNGVVQISKDELTIKPYDEFDNFVWEKSIIPMDFMVVDQQELNGAEFMQFLVDLTTVEDPEKAMERLKSLKSAIGYLLHKFKDPATTKSIILMDVYVNGLPNGGSGKTLLISSIGKVRNLSIIDGKKYDQREWFALSSVDLESELLLFDDVAKDFDFEQIFPLMTTGMYVRLKYKNHVFIPFEKAPKIAITTNYAINGTSSSFVRRMFEFEISATYSANYSPRERFGHNFFEGGWEEKEWLLFYNVMFECLQGYLKEGLLESEPINMRLTKLINQTSEEFVEWAEINLELGKQYSKKQLHDNFTKTYREYLHKLKQREFTAWLRTWGDYMKLTVIERHSGDLRYIQYVAKNVS